MAVTEIALLSTKATETTASSATSTIPPHILSLLEKAASAQATYSSWPVTLLQVHSRSESQSQIQSQPRDEPIRIFLIGGWESTSVHMNEWIPGPINQGLLKEMSEYVDVKWMWHLNCEPGEVASLLTRDERVGQRGVVRIGKYVVADEKKNEWEDRLRSKVNGDGDKGGRGEAYGWRLDLGFVGDGADGESENGMKEVENTVVLFSVGPGQNEAGARSQIVGALEADAVEKDVWEVEVIKSSQP